MDLICLCYKDFSMHAVHDMHALWEFCLRSLVCCSHCASLLVFSNKFSVQIFKSYFVNIFYFSTSSLSVYFLSAWFPLCFYKPATSLILMSFLEVKRLNNFSKFFYRTTRQHYFLVFLHASTFW